MNDVRLNIYQLCILFRLLYYKLGAKLFEPGSKMKELYGEMISPQFGKYSYIHEGGTKAELI